MKLIKCGLLLLALALSQSLWADVTLSRSVMESYFNAIEAMKPLEARYQSEFDQLAQQNQVKISDGGKQWAEKIQALPFAGEIKSVLAEYGFDSVEDFTEVASKLMAGVMSAYNTEAEREEMKAAMAASDVQMQQLRDSGMSEAMLQQMQAQMDQAKQMMQEFEAAEAQLSDADKAAIADNLDWLKTQFDLMDDQ